MQDDILVSCTVVSYNSADTVIETLESIKAQTYQNIELIVSDDCSTDNTVELCRDWITENKKRFVRTVLLTVDKNTGVAGNCNRALSECHGVWHKGIAADDILLPNCIKDYMSYVKEHPGANYVCAFQRSYRNTFDDCNCFIKKQGPTDISIFSTTTSIEEQTKRMAYQQYVWAPTIFYSISLFEKVGGYREQYAFEDWPFNLDVLECGYRIYLLDKVTVGYRFHQSSSHIDTKLFNYAFSLKTRLFIKERCFKYYSKRKLIAVRIEWFIESFLHYLHLDNATLISRFFYKKTLAILYRIGNS